MNAKKMMIYLAIYDMDGKLMAITEKTAKRGDASVEIEIPVDAAFVGCEYKILLWNPINLFPYTDVFDGTVSSK